MFGDGLLGNAKRHTSTDRVMRTFTLSREAKVLKTFSTHLNRKDLKPSSASPRNQRNSVGGRVREVAGIKREYQVR